MMIFQEEEEFTENTNISLPYNISMGIKEKQILKDIFHKNNVELKEDELLNINNIFLLYKNDVLHCSNDLQLLESIIKEETKPYSKIKESYVPKPNLYGNRYGIYSFGLFSKIYIR